MLSCRAAAPHEHGLDFSIVQPDILLELCAANDMKVLPHYASYLQGNLAEAPSLTLKPRVCPFPLLGGMKHKAKDIQSTQNTLMFYRCHGRGRDGKLQLFLRAFDWLHDTEI